MILRQACPTEQPAALRTQAVRLIQQAERGLPIPYYYLQYWAPLLSPAEFLTITAFRQAGWVSQARGTTATADLHLSDLTRWCGLSSQRLDQVTAQGKYLDWFIQKLTPRSNRKARDRWSIERDIPIAPQHLYAIHQYIEDSLPSWLAQGKDISAYLEDLGERIYWIVSSARLSDAARWVSGRSTLQSVIESVSGKPLSQAMAQVCAAIQRRILHVSGLKTGDSRNALWVSHYFLEHCLPRLGSQMGVAVLRLKFLRDSGQYSGPLYISDTKSGYETLAGLLCVDFRTARKWVRGLIQPDTEGKSDPHLIAFSAYFQTLPMGRDVISIETRQEDPIWPEEYALFEQTLNRLEAGYEDPLITEAISAYRQESNDAHFHESLCFSGSIPFMVFDDNLTEPDRLNDKSFHELPLETNPFMNPDTGFHEQDNFFHDKDANPFMEPDKSFHDWPSLNKESLKTDSWNPDSFESETNQLSMLSVQTNSSSDPLGFVGWFPEEIQSWFSMTRLKPRTKSYQEKIKRVLQDGNIRLRFTAWMLWAYERIRKDADQPGIASPELYALNQLDSCPPRAYLELAKRSPADLLGQIETPFRRHGEAEDRILNRLEKTPLVDLLQEIIPPDVLDPPDESHWENPEGKCSAKPPAPQAEITAETQNGCLEEDLPAVEITGKQTDIQDSGDVGFQTGLMRIDYEIANPPSGSGEAVILDDSVLLGSTAKSAEGGSGSVNSLSDMRIDVASRPLLPDQAGQGRATSWESGIRQTDPPGDILPGSEAIGNFHSPQIEKTSLPVSEPDSGGVGEGSAGSPSEPISGTNQSLNPPLEEGVVGASAPQAAVLWNTLRAFLKIRIKGMPTHFVDDILVLKVLTLEDAHQTLEQLTAQRDPISLTGLVSGFLILPLQDGAFPPLHLDLETI